jgi:TRAP-type mannitol/chloroaromatic compound transport system permease small subunit
MAPKVKSAATDPASSPVTDSSISIDGDHSPNVGALIIDAIAAAVAIAFTVLLVQDIIPFL